MRVPELTKDFHDDLKRGVGSISCKSIYFLGGENIKERDCININREVLNEVKEPRIIVIPWTTENLEKERRYREIIYEYFMDLGAESIVFLERHHSPEEIESRMMQANVLYLPGGDPRVLHEEISRRGYLRRMIKEFTGVIVGNSAGAMILGREALLMENRYFKVIKGLHLVEFCVHPHYTVDMEKYILAFSRNRVVFAIPSRNAIIYRPLNNFEIIGEVSLFIEGKKLGTFYGLRL